MVTLRWNAPTSTGGDNVSGYDVKAFAGATQVTGLTVTITTTGFDSPRATVEGLTNGTEYTFRVAARNAVGSGTELVSAAVRTGPRVRLTSATPNYGDVDMGSTSNPLVITITNWGSADLLVNGPLVTSSPAGANFAVVFDNCSGNIVPAKGTCRTDLSFTPVKRGPITGTFQLSSNSIDPSPTINLSGRGVGPAIAYSPSSLAFGSRTVGTESGPQTVTITNNSPPDTGRDLHINSVSIEGFGAPNYVIDQASDLCTAATLKQGQSCTLTVKFAPIRTGPADATLRVEHDAFVDPPRVTLSGTGT